jgi:hypothetical protein
MSVTKVSSAMTVVQPRNFIIDGGMTQWPEGAGATTIVTNTYSQALSEMRFSHDGSATWERSTDVPTIDAAKHLNLYSLLVKCTGTDGTIASTQYMEMWRHYITGSDFSALHEQQVTISFWAKTASNNSGDTCYLLFNNRASDRSYVHAFNPTSTWTQFTHTLTMDTSGTWASIGAESDYALRILISGSSGTDHDDGTNDAWVGTFERWDSSTAIGNFMSSTSNEFYITQVGLYLGSTAPTFTGESVATVRDQVDFYVQRWDLDSASTEHGVMGAGHALNTSTIHFTKTFNKEMRKIPTMTSSGSGTFEAYYQGSTTDFGVLTASAVGTHGCRYSIPAASGTPFTAGDAVNIRRDGTDVSFIQADARH